LNELAGQDFPTPDGEESNYAVLLVRACIDSICISHRRKESMEAEERMKTAESVVRHYGHWRAWELKDFEDKLDNELIGVQGLSGQVEYAMGAVDRASLLRRFKAYDRSRTSEVREQDQVPDSMAALVEKRTTGWRKSPFNIYSDYHKTHDSDGNLVVDPRDFGGTPPDNPGWDYESHWDQWYRTHLADGTPAPEGFDAEAYWKGDLKKNNLQQSINCLSNNLRPDGV